MTIPTIRRKIEYITPPNTLSQSGMYNIEEINTIVMPIMPI
jgi:hypothetical protein